jgi:hypothetical protein
VLPLAVELLLLSSLPRYASEAIADIFAFIRIRIALVVYLLLL